MKRIVKYDSFDPNCEVIGMAMVAILHSFNKDKFQHLIDNHDLNEIDPNEWYLLQKWLDFLTDLKNEPNTAINFTSIGMHIASQLPHQNEANSYEEVLLNHPALYHSTHRNGDDGYYSIEKSGSKHYIVTTRVPYPDELVYGSLWGEAKRYLPNGQRFTVAFDSNTTRRDLGGEVTVIHIKID